jgi:hypothetical protein
MALANFISLTVGVGSALPPLTKVRRVDMTVEEIAAIVETTEMTTAGGHVETSETDPETVLGIDLGKEIIDPVGGMIGMIVGNADAETDEIQGMKGENVRTERASIRIETVVEMIAEKRVGKQLPEEVFIVRTRQLRLPLAGPIRARYSMF